MNIRVIAFTTLLLMLLGACDNFDPQSYVPGLETNTPAKTQEPGLHLPVSLVEPSPRSAATQSLTLKVCTNIVGGKLHVRFEPGNNSDVRGYLAEGEAVTVGEKSEERDGGLWIQLSDPIQGWVNATYLCPAN
jgi:hypothetical protein